MSENRDTYKYWLKVGNKVVHIGITKNLEHRELQHRRDWPGSKIYVLGHRTTEEAARKWEREQVSKVKIEPKELREISSSTSSMMNKFKGKIFKTLG